ncbi:NFX1-type zinc finger-containing protein 1-like isoform X2 [Zerene cesonia]|uniref:NFX1-type zinc finger-containing protein 1-like isoform X2 n=1 Tax=Zerene cesonia TaxID=33412 RepID=UPI0018E5A62C|nr:NFX1-type zinc finger-containing protein 1-like isoform X2 [Zerene cesonia]
MAMEFVACPEACKARLACGHACTRTCHVKSDPDHEMYTCEKPCRKLKKDCSFTAEENNEDHLCKKKCYETCDVCKVEVMKKRQNCIHSQKVPCHVDVNTILCRKNCARLLPCNHHCKKKCHEPCGDCVMLVVKKIPDCNHKVKVPCNKFLDSSMCKAECQRVMSCGHPCQSLCGEPCDPENCNHLMNYADYSPCGHKIALPCKIYQAIRSGDKVDLRVLLKHCKAACKARLECGHECAGTCAACWQGRLHAPCQQRCDKLSICGHVYGTHTTHCCTRARARRAGRAARTRPASSAATSSASADTCTGRTLLTAAHEHVRGVLAGLPARALPAALRQAQHLRTRMQGAV